MSDDLIAIYLKNYAFPIKMLWVKNVLELHVLPKKVIKFQNLIAPLN